MNVKTHDTTRTGHDDTVPKRGKAARLGMRVAAGLIGVIAALALTGLTYQAFASWLDDRSHTAPGTLVDVGDRNLHLWCSGTGNPTVILEAGLGGSSYDWSYVRDDIADSVRVCAYDRAGTGWSDPLDAPQSSTEVAHDLKALLVGAGESGPFVLAGHSAGGIHVRRFAELYPDDVSGMVLIDSSHENQTQRLDMLGALDDVQRSQLETCALVSRLGVMRVLGVHDGTVPAETSLSEETREAWLSRLYRTSFCDAALGELEMILIETGRTDPPKPLGDLPLIVLSRGQALSFSDVGNTEGITQEMLDDATRVGGELQQELAELSTNGSRRVVADSGHYIHWDQPAIVAQAILELAGT